MVCKVGQWAFASSSVLCYKSKCSKHGESAVLEFLQFQCVEVALGESSGVEDATGVSGSVACR